MVGSEGMHDDCVYSFSFDQIAQEQLAEAIEFYNENASIEVGKRFLTKVETVIEILCSWPEIGRVLDDFPVVRSFKIPKYPYRIYYRIDDELIEVVALSIYHSRRDLDALINDLKLRLGRL